MIPHHPSLPFPPPPHLLILLGVPIELLLRTRSCRLSHSLALAPSSARATTLLLLLLQLQLLLRLSVYCSWAGKALGIVRGFCVRLERELRVRPRQLRRKRVLGGGELALRRGPL